MINWYPGHMEKSRRLINRNLKMVNLIIEVCDIRAPMASSNPILQEAIDRRAVDKILLLNKHDLADKEATRLWLEKFALEGYTHTLTISATSPKMEKILINSLEAFRKRNQKRKLIVLICGIPNSGKSTIINAISKRRKVKVGATPGLTRHVEKILVSQNLEFLDSPGLLWPRFESHIEALKLSAIGAIKETVLPAMDVLYGILFYLMQCYPRNLEKYSRINSYTVDLNQYILSLAHAKGCLQSEGRIDYVRMCQTLLKDLRKGKLGQVSFEWPDGRGWANFAENC